MIDVSVLKQALPYIQRYKGKAFIVKMGGEIAQDADALEDLAKELALLHQLGIRLVVVHGGGPQATALSQRLGHEVRMVDGRRVTDDDTLEVAKMVFAGKINVEILAALREEGARAVGVSGVDGDIIRAKRREAKTIFNKETGKDEVVDFGHVGDIEAVDTNLLRTLVEHGYVPVVSSLGADGDGNIYNINADTVAAELAKDLQAEKLIFLTDVPGILADRADPASVISHVSLRKAQELLVSGVVSKGMAPKLQCCVDAVMGGVHRAHIVSGKVRNSLLAEVFTTKGTGTMVLRQSEEEEYIEEARRSNSNAPA